MSYYVYIMTNKHNTVLYTGVTGNLGQRVYEHKNKIRDGFTAKYNVNKLVFAEYFNDVKYALEAEKQIKSWSRSRKTDLIFQLNPHWVDLYNRLQE